MAQPIFIQAAWCALTFVGDFNQQFSDKQPVCCHYMDHFSLCAIQSFHSMIIFYHLLRSLACIGLTKIFLYKEAKKTYPFQILCLKESRALNYKPSYKLVWNSEFISIESSTRIPWKISYLYNYKTLTILIDFLVDCLFLRFLHFRAPVFN